ncbi:hypothetical protein CK934_27800 [Chitinophaga sp. MD30]|nr:hypothetical protein CK934_27800 [Chitinophaga sp. MD30]
METCLLQHILQVIRNPVVHSCICSPLQKSLIELTHTFRYLWRLLDFLMVIVKYSKTAIFCQQLFHLTNNTSRIIYPL